MVFEKQMLHTAMASSVAENCQWHQQYENQTNICELVLPTHKYLFDFHLVTCIELFHWLNECKQFMTCTYIIIQISMISHLAGY